MIFQICWAGGESNDSSNMLGGESNDISNMLGGESNDISNMLGGESNPPYFKYVGWGVE